MIVDRGRARRSGSVLRTLAMVVVAGAFMFGCHNTLYTYGTSVITFSSTPGPFSSYVVAVQEITLTRSDGVVVYPVGLSGGTAIQQTVDFTRLGDHSEVFGAPALPEGTYTSATVLMNYTTTSIFTDVNGTNVQLTPHDSSGNTMSTVSYTVSFDPSAPFVIKNGVSTPLDINFDLAASSVINLANKTVVTRPFLTLNTEPEYSGPMRVRGLFVTAKGLAANTFVLNSRPFNDVLSPSPYGSVNVATTDSTVFAINGVNYTGAAGLQAMQQLQINTNVGAYGTLTNLGALTPTFTATQVLVGFSQDDQLEDRVTGVVAARSGNTIVLHGAGMFTRPGTLTTGNALFQDSLTMTVGAATVVTRDNSAATLSAAAISVGQRINVGGNLNDSSGKLVSSSGGTPANLDATNGYLRLTATPLWGALNAGASGSSASFNLLTLGDYEPNVFNFTGTGQVGMDATPSAYIVDTTAAGPALAGAPAGTLARADGFVTPFGSAPPDFDATAVTPGTAVDQILVVDWINGGSKAAFANITTGQLVLNLSDPNLGSSHAVLTGPTSIDLTSPGGNVTIVPDTTTHDILAYGSPATNMSLFNSFAPFATGLDGLVNSGQPVQKVVAVGHYDELNRTFTAHRVDFVRE